jgi:exodeoxyribonuclease V alpha subunit
LRTAIPALATKILRAYRSKATEVVSTTPYRLALDVPSIGFKTADTIAEKAGIARDAPERAQAAVVHALHKAEDDGHLYLLRPDVVRAAKKLTEMDAEALDDAIEAMVADGHLVLDDAPAGAAVYLKATLELEQAVARRTLALLAAKLGNSAPMDPRAAVERFEARRKMTLAPEQRAAVELAAASKVVVLTGGPGVGKTTIVRALLSMYVDAGLQVRLAAPTGRAAKRIKETTGDESASTIHRLLGVDPKTRKFIHRRGYPIPNCDVVILDESSMIDLALADSLLQALPDGARVVFVGDVDQLPSVGAGAVLRDLIASAVIPTARLTQIFRQAEGSLIVENAHRINAGQMPETSPSPEGEFHVVYPRYEEGAEQAALADAVLEIVARRIPRRFGFDPRTEVRVLTPMHKGAAGTSELNRRLQEALNPPGPDELRRGEVTFRVGDTVMVRKNDPELDVYNGDVGTVVAVNHGEVGKTAALVLRIDDREVAFGDKEIGGMLQIAYATTVHKMQGSEIAAVVVVLGQAHWTMLSRNLVYTAVTRGKKLVVLVADPRAVGTALRAERREDRNTLLAERLRRGA